MKNWIAFVAILVILQSAWAADFTLDLQNPTKATYPNFLDAIRNRAKDQTGLTYGGPAPYGIPVMAAPLKPPQYYRVDLITDTLVGVALNKADLYLVAYLSKNDAGKFQVHYFSGAISTMDIDKVFPEAKGVTKPVTIGYAENYGAIETKAGVKSRRDVGLGIAKLESFIGKVSGKKFDIKTEAQFLLVAIQMVSEAARFKYIETEVVDNYPNGFTPDTNVLILEDNWERISSAIKLKSNKGVFTEAMTFEDSQHKYSWTVTKVADLGAALLKNLEGKQFNVFQILTTFLRKMFWSSSETIQNDRQEF